MASAIKPSFGDNVVIRENPETAAAGVAGKTGCVSGFTTPSITDVHVIGGTAEDFALCVMFDDRSIPDTWFIEEYVQFVDHAPGTEFQVGNVKAVRTNDGTWIETRLDGTPLTQTGVARPWWKFW